MPGKSAARPRGAENGPQVCGADNLGLQAGLH
jgi:hypothetical protein